MQQVTDTHTMTSSGPRFGDVLVLGLGVSGLGVARYCLGCLEAGDASITSLTIWTGGDSEKVRAAAACFEEAGIKVVFGSEEVEGAFDKIGRASCRERV